MKKMYWLVPLGAFVAIQFIRPDLSNPPVDPALDIQQVLQAPTEVHAILQGACYDCHSNETKYPWYSQVAPVSWWLADHIQEGREHLNFSTIGSLPAKERAEVLGEAAEEVQEGEMPLNSYTWTHPAARLNATQRDLVLTWLNANGENEGRTQSGNEAGQDSATNVEEQAHSDDD